ncbi:MAG: glycosyltransferase [Rhizobiales bacterium]|nr:glycosyltransferase [Hyphomicrobiales bacterium]
MSKLKIMLLLARADTGGAPEHVYQLIKALSSEVEFFMACPTDRPYFQRFSALVGADHMVEIPHRKISLSAMYRVYSTVKKQKIPLMHAHGKGGGLYGRLIGLVANVKRIYTPHGMDPTARNRFWLSESDIWLDFMMDKISHASICVSAGEKREILACYVSKASKLVVIDNGVTMGLPRRHHAVAGQKLKLVAVSRYDAQKNPDELIEIIASLQNRSIPGGFHLTVLGEGAGRAGFETKLSERGLSEFVTVSGAVSDVRSTFHKSDVLITTSIWEGMPLALLEATSEGLPVVASDVVGNNDIIQDGDNGLLYPLGQPERAADQIMLLSDPEIRQRFADAGRKLVQTKHSVDFMAQQVLALYGRILRGEAPNLPSETAVDEEGQKVAGEAA